MAKIHARLLEQGQLAFSSLFEPGMHRSTTIGLFLAVLELVRHAHVKLNQNDLFREIWLMPNLQCAEPLNLSNVDTYGS
jgi:segregation and condensation protein A